MRHLIDIMDFSAAEIDELIATATDIVAHPEKYREKCRYKKLATLFLSHPPAPAFPLRRQ